MRKTHSSSIDHRCGNRREIPDLRLDRQNPATAAECKRWGSGEHRAPTVSSAQHWYPSSVDQTEIWYVPWTIGCRGVGGGISTDVDREIDSGQVWGVLSGFFPSRAATRLARIRFVLLVLPSCWATDRLNDANSNKSRKIRNRR